jgi:hypothetical protein
MGGKGHSRGGMGTPRHLALDRSCLISKADEGCSQDGTGWRPVASAQETVISVCCSCSGRSAECPEMQQG